MLLSGKELLWYFGIWALRTHALNQFLPFMFLFQAILAVIILANLKGMFKQFKDIPELWKSNFVDLVRKRGWESRGATFFAVLIRTLTGEAHINRIP